VQQVILGNRRQATTKRPGEVAPQMDLEATREELHRKLRRRPTENDLFSYIMYPQVFLDFDKSRKTYDSLSGLPTTAFFYGLRLGEEISVDIDEGKTLFIKLVSVSEADAQGVRTLFYELNGMPREAQVIDSSKAVASSARPKGDPENPAHVIAPMPGMITHLAVGVGSSVKQGDKLVTLEAMKMLTSVGASRDGVVSELLVHQGDTVAANDLLLRLE
jgi:pyruvate carboxylase